MTAPNRVGTTPRPTGRDVHSGLEPIHPDKLPPTDVPTGSPAPVKPLWRGWLHLVWFELSLVVGTALILRIGPDHRVALTVYTVAVSALFGASALYHRGSWRPRTRGVLQRLDHAMVFVLIGGSATPVFAATLHGTAQAVSLTIVWTVTAVAIVTHLIWMHASELLVGSMYVAFACIGVVCLPVVWIHSGVAAGLLMGLGGVLYVGGGLLYHDKRPDPSPRVFGYHEVFHAFVCAGATAHYLAIVFLIT